MSNTILTWVGAAISSCCVLIDGYMLAGNIRDQRSQPKKRSHQHLHPRWVQTLQSVAWACFLVANVFQTGFMVGYATLDRCGDVAVYVDTTHTTPKWWTKNCIITTLEIFYQVLGFLPLPVFPILHMRLVVQLHQYSSRTRGVITACTGGTVLAMLVQIGFTVLIVLAERIPRWGSLHSVMFSGYSYSYDAHMLLVLAMGASSIFFILQFLGTITARVVATPTPHQRPTSSSTLSASHESKLHRSAGSRPPFDPHHHSTAIDRVAQFNAAVAHVRRMSYTSVGMLVVLVGAIVVANLFIVHPLLMQSLISLLGQCLLASFSLTTGRMRPLMIMRRQLPTTDAGTLATDWSAAISNAATASHMPMVPEADARLTIIESRED
ncbi:hypothetical protein BC828DRAFT_389405 [Blastocladiella britannica]|nr:hypothetical protein BC828DRAFT_389405 [Blastocladiella britannica]